MPSVHGPRRRSSPESSEGRSTLPWLGLGALLVLLTLGGAWWAGLFGKREDPRVTEVKGVMRDMAKQYPPTEGPKNMLDAAARVGAMVTVLGKIQALPEELRPQALEEGRKIMMQAVGARVDQYFAAPPDQRDKLIDDQIKQMQSMQKAFEGGRSMFQGLAGAGGGGNGGGGNGNAGSKGNAPANQTAGGPGSRSEEDRNKWRKDMLDKTSPSERARWNEYFGAIDRRRQALGLPGGGGPFGPR